MEDELKGARGRQLFMSSREHVHPFHTTVPSVQYHGRQREGCGCCR